MNDSLKTLMKLAQGTRTQNAFSRDSGVPSASITRIIQGVYKPSPDTLKKIACAARNGVTYEMLMQAAGYLPDEKSKQDFEPKADHDIRRLERAKEKMPAKDWNRALQILELSFSEYFDEGDPDED